MTDVRLFQTNDGGEISVVGGQFEISNGLESAVYLSMFGGNEDDGGLTSDESAQWWGNFDEPDLARRYRSETQYLLRSIPATSNNLRRVKDAMSRDLAWMVGSLVESVDIAATIPRLNTITMAVAFVIDGRESIFELTKGWTGRA